MKNREKFAKEILDIACKGSSIAMNFDGNLVSCSNFHCHKCKFNIDYYNDCNTYIEKWCEAEYVEKPTLTLKENLFIGLIRTEYKYIARDEDGLLSVYPRKPEKKSTYWLLTDNPNSARDLYTRALDVNFDFIKWEDEEPWLIEDLKKLEVKD